ncbi:CDP-diacylglycerol--glycerol-3-phosphate 3-phosphatidyltransferase [Olsenella sp. KGMB02461]|nr:CDP-diacylglycerol--glycerol-3-phosphate 3-phosphatidyltransferase [Olsenella sp. KGMB02461]
MAASSRQPGPQKPSTLMTAANIVTLVRVACIFVWLLLAGLCGPAATTEVSWAHLGLAAFYGLIAGTDSLDGYLARSRNEVTDFGKFLDPIADKLVVVAALLYLMDASLVSLWVIVVIVAREFLVSGLRMVVASKGVVVAASRLGKWKTATTMGAIAGYLVAMALPAGPFASLLYGASWIAMAAAVVLTLWSGADYFMKCWAYIR